MLADFSFPIRNCHGWRDHGHLKIRKRYAIFLNPVNCRMRCHPEPLNRRDNVPQHMAA
jgi:hypothetical protein